MRLSPLCLSTLLFAPSVLAQRVLEVEPNNTAATAQAVTLGTQIDASLAPVGDQDWYSFTLAASTRVRIHTSSINSTIVAHGDTRIQLWNAAGTTVLAIDDDQRGTTNGWTSDVTMNLAAGTYAVQVVPFDVATTTGPYSVEVAELSPARVYNGFEVEPNNTHLTATPTTLATGANYFHGNTAASVSQLSETVPATTVVLSDVVVTSTTTVITATAPLVASAYTGGGFSVQMTSGVNSGLIRLISANTATTITTAAWPVPNGVGDTYNVITTVSTTVIRATGALTAGAFTPPAAGFGRYYVRFTSGTNVGLSRQISANTASTITCTAFPLAPLPADTFEVDLVDMDYWQVVLTAPTTGVFLLITEGDAPWVLGHRFEIYDSAGVPVSATTLGTNNGNANPLSARTSTTRVWPAGTFYIVVRPPAAPVTAPAPSVISPTGNYCLELHLMPMDTAGVTVEAEPVGGPNSNNTAATAIPITTGQIGQGNITISTGADPSDWWGPVVINTPSTITFQTRQGAATALMDSTINLRDPSGAILLSATAGNILSPTSHARITVTFFLTPVTGYIEVISPGTGATQAGNYELQLSSIVPAPYVLGSYGLIAANATCGVAPLPALANQYTVGTTVTGSEAPMLGNTFSRDLRSCPPAAMFIHMIGFSNTLAGGVTPLPFDMSVVGAPGCTINVDPVILIVGVTDATGAANLLTTIPSSMVFRGFVWYDQCIVNNPAANPFGVQISNYARAIVGDRSY